MAKGHELADCIRAYRQSQPTGRVYVVTHDAGVSVALAAAGCLPAGSVTRFVFLAPAVSPIGDVAALPTCLREGLTCSTARRTASAAVLARGRLFGRPSRRRRLCEGPRHRRAGGLPPGAPARLLQRDDRLRAPRRPLRLDQIRRLRECVVPLLGHCPN